MSSQGPRLTREQAAEQTRERLLSSAREVFVARGYHAASIYEIAERAGRTIGALYAHFGGKEGVFLALVDRHFEDQLELYSKRLEETAGPDEALRAGGEFWSEFLEQDRDVVVLFVEFWSYAMRDPQLRTRLAGSLRRVRSELARLVEGQRRALGLPEGAVRALDAAIAFDALIDGFALNRLIDPDQLSDEVLLRALQWMARGMLADASKEIR